MRLELATPVHAGCFPDAAKSRVSEPVHQRGFTLLEILAVLALMGLLFATTATLLSNLLADIAYAWLDPRISLS